MGLGNKAGTALLRDLVRLGVLPLGDSAPQALGGQ